MPAAAVEVVPYGETGSVSTSANLRGGPGTGNAIVGSAALGESVSIVGRNLDGSWLLLDNGAWIAASLVVVGSAPAPISTPVSVAAPPSPPASTDTPVPAPTDTPAPAGVPNVVIEFLYYDGQVARVESDEYAVIANVGTASANLAGWCLNAGDSGQDFWFPPIDLAPGQQLRVYTNEVHPESGGHSFGSGSAIWNNKGECGYLFDSTGQEVSTRCY